MRLERDLKTYPSDRLLACMVYARKDLRVARATELYYRYVGENSYLPISDLLLPEDGQFLLQAAENFTGPIEMVTGFTGSKGGYKNIYLRMEESEETEDGAPLFLITLYDIVDVENRVSYLETQVSKYRFLLGLTDCYYFEYTAADNMFVVYKYVNESAIRIISSDLDEYVENNETNPEVTVEQKERMKTFVAYMKGKRASFDMEFPIVENGETSFCRIRGGSIFRNEYMVAGVFQTHHHSMHEAYYLTPAARDAGTGVFNKKAGMEYAMEKLQMQDGKPRWLLMLDIDDFKNVNDTFGHMFGDEVIRHVASTLQNHVGYRGIVSRFGGDEFFVFLEKVNTREELKLAIKAIVKELAIAFDPKLRITVSVGAAQYPKEGTTYEELIAKADKAVYIAKEKGKDRHIIYEEALHGKIEKDNMRLRAASYSLSREKRREALIELMGNLYSRGIQYLTENSKAQKLVREMFDLDGMTIYTDGGETVVCRSGHYALPPVTGEALYLDDKYVELFGNNNVLVESSMLKLKAVHLKAYELAMKQEIGATVQCIARKGDKVHALVSFDTFNCNRKWSDIDIEMLSILGGCIGRLLCEERE